MAYFYPDSDKTRVVFPSNAEQQFYEHCRLHLDDQWHVFHSVTLSGLEEGQGLQDNEIDFLLYHPRYGAIAVEVKGGRIHYDAASGRYRSVNRHGESFAIKDPFQQVLSWKSRFIRRLKKEGLRVPVSHAVVLPAVKEDDLLAVSGSAVEGAVLLGRDRLKNLGSSLVSLVKASQPPQYLEFKDVQAELEKLVVGASFTTRLFLRDYLDAHETRVKDIEAIHETLLTPIASSHRLGVEGEAGTGKTMLASMLAKKFRDDGQRVLILSSNALLNSLLRKDLGEGIDLQTYPELAAGYGMNLLIPPSEFTGEKDDWIQYEAPDRLKKAILDGRHRYDVVICDEAQDVQPFWWEAIEALLDKEAEEPRFYLFFDRSQGVFGSGDGRQFSPEDVLPVAGPYFPLVHNYRTTREISGFAREFRTGTHVLQSHSGRVGYVPELVTYKDAEDARRKMAQLVRTLVRDEGLRSDEFTLLSARNPAARESILYKQDDVAKFKLRRLVAPRNGEAQTDLGEQEIGVATIAGFKGMETSVGILCNLSEYNLPASNPIMSSLIYVACTRAKHMLYVFVQEDDTSKREAFAKALSAIDSHGEMIIEGSQADFEFAGTVSHYNQDRVGWLTVDDPAFEQGKIMFFPADVEKAGIKNLRTGMKLKFRPRVEGHATIAADLSLARNVVLIDTDDYQGPDRRTAKRGA